MPVINCEHERVQGRCGSFPKVIIDEFPEPYDGRRRAIGIKMFEIRGIKREDKDKRRWWQEQGLRLFGAPCAIYIYTDRSFYAPPQGVNVWPVFDCGLVAGNIMLLATRCGLGTICQIQAVHFPEVLRSVLGLPDSALIIMGIAVGYPDWDAPINQLQAGREPVDRITRWCGFGPV